MNCTPLIESIIKSMMHSPIHNYIIPGLSSYLLGQPSDTGIVRLFSCARDHKETIAPHSHRYDFSCYVLKGYVTNHIWYPADNGDDYAISINTYLDEIGAYEQTHSGIKKFKYKSSNFATGEWYGMTHKEIHSINFSKDSMVLFFQGQDRCKESMMLEPYVNGKIIPTGTVMPWMFQTG